MGLFITSLIANCQWGRTTRTCHQRPRRPGMHHSKALCQKGAAPRQPRRAQDPSAPTLTGGAPPLKEFFYQRIPSTEDTVKGACGKGAPSQKAHHQSGVQSSIQRAVNDSRQSPTLIPTFLRSPGREFSHA